MHDLRRRHALKRSAAPRKLIKQILNHASAVGITRLYARSDPLPRMREWLDKLGEHYDQLSASPTVFPNTDDDFTNT
jgi:N-acetylglutamate synthase-like GNAT family acetyltransferase